MRSLAELASTSSASCGHDFLTHGFGAEKEVNRRRALERLDAKDSVMDLDEISRTIAVLAEHRQRMLEARRRYATEGPLVAPTADFEAALEQIHATERELRLQEALLSTPSAALEHDRERHRELFLEAPVGLVVTTREGTIRELNVAAAKLFGRRATDAIGSPLQQFVHAADLARFAVLRQRMRIETHATASDTLTIDSNDRLRRTNCIVTAGRVLDQRGATKGMWFALDELGTEPIPERAEDAWLDPRNGGARIAMLAHELRNPLAPIRAVVELWRSQGGDARLGTERGIQILDRQITHLTRLVEDLVDVSHASLPSIQLRRETLDLRDVIGHAMEGVQVAAQGHALRADLPGVALWVNADPTRLRQIVANLVDNAIKYTPTRGEIVVTARGEGGHAVISVRDSGIGLSRNMLERVFEPLTQSDAALARSQDGFGLGLALVRRLVHLHGGTVRANSEGPGQGSVFTVCLPRVVAPRMREPSSDSRVRRMRGRTALVVDDNVDAAELLVAVLSAEGHKATPSFDGASAMEAFERIRPDIVLLDLGLPDIHGLELARHFRARNPAAVIVAVTGYGDERNRTRGREAGCDHYLLKPVDFRVLRQILLDPDPDGMHGRHAR